MCTVSAIEDMRKRLTSVVIETLIYDYRIGIQNLCTDFIHSQYLGVFVSFMPIVSCTFTTFLSFS